MDDAPAREHQVGRRQHIAHILDIGLDRPTACLLIRQGQKVARRLKVIGAGRVHNMQAGDRKQALFQRGDALVEVMGAKRAAKDQQQGLVLAHPQRRAAASAVALKHGAAHRVAGHDNLGMGAGVFAEDSLNAGLRDSDKGRGLGGLLVGKAGHGVLLV